MRMCHFGSIFSPENSAFVAPSLRIKLALPQTARLSIFLIGKSVALHLREGPEIRTHY